jgi:hypothetical protein
MVALADVYADVAEDVERGCRMEADLRHCEVIQIALRLHRARLATHRNRDVRIVFAVELVGPQPLQEIDRLVDARLHLGPAVVLLRQAWQRDNSEPFVSARNHKEDRRFKSLRSTNEAVRTAGPVFMELFTSTCLPIRAQLPGRRQGYRR